MEYTERFTRHPSRNPRAASFKAACDFAAEKSDSWQEYAAFMAAEFTSEFLKARMGRAVANSLSVWMIWRADGKEDDRERDPEIVAISAVHTALKALESEAQARVLSYAENKLNIEASTVDADPSSRRPPEDRRDADRARQEQEGEDA
jgi:hypothetical protein